LPVCNGVVSGRQLCAAAPFEQPIQVGRYYKDLTLLIGKEIFSPSHQVHSYYTAAYIAYRLEFMFRTAGWTRSGSLSVSNSPWLPAWSSNGN
jgi:hypothetical protein